MLGLTLQQFKCWRGVLWSVHGTGGRLRKLSIHSTTAATVPLPTPSVHEPPPDEQPIVVPWRMAGTWAWAILTPLTSETYSQPLPRLQLRAWHCF